MSTNEEDINLESKREVDGNIPLNDHTSVVSSESGIEPFADLQLSDLPSEYTRQKTVVVLVGPEQTQYSVHRGLFAAKSLFFRTMFKDCWDGKKEETKIGNISSDGFGIVVDWIYSGQLPDRVKEYSEDGPQPWASTLHAYKAVDVLMINKLQNEIIATEAAIFSKYDLKWRFDRL